MIPVELTIQGLYSYQQKQTIDFRKLTGAHLFGIFGSVGSGKSTILEAITFAIYGKTDRLNLSGDNRYYNMMNLKSNELLIDFIFETGKDQTAYRAVVKGRRSGKNFEDVKTLDRTAYIRSGGEWIPVETGTLEKVVGLSYDNFKRTIIIPQGQFQEFLQLGNKDRTQMMKELFNLGKYEFYAQVTSIESRNNAQKQHVEGQLQQLGEMNPGQVNEYQSSMDQLRKDLDEAGLQLNTLTRQEEQWRQLQELKKKEEELKTELNRLKAQEPEFLQLEKNIARYEQCAIHFRHLVEALQSGKSRIVQKEKQLRDDRLKLAAGQEEISRLERQIEEIRPGYEKREELRQSANELTILIKIKELEGRLVKDRARLEKGNAFFEETLKTVEAGKKEKEELAERNKAEKLKLPDLSELAQAKSWHTDRRNLDSQFRDLEVQVRKSEEELKAVQSDLFKLYEDPVFKELPAGSGPADAMNCLHTRLEEIKEKLKQGQETADRLRVNVRLKEFAEQLQEGDPCPLCGSVHHPQIYSEAGARDESERLAKVREEGEKEKERIYGLINRLNELDSRLKIGGRQHQELRARTAELQKRISSHQALFKWEKYRDAMAVERALTEADYMQIRIRNNERTLEELNRKYEKAVKDKDRFQQELEKIRTSLTVSETELKTLQQQLRLIDPEEYRNSTMDGIEEQKQELMQKYTRLERLFNEYTQTLTSLRKSADMLSGSIATGSRQLEQEQTVILDLKRQFEEQLHETGFSSEDEVIQILGQQIVPEHEKQKLAAFREKLALTQNRAGQLQKEIGDRQYDAEAHQKLLQEMKGIQEMMTQKNQELGKTSELLKKLKKDLENQVKLKKELEQLDLRAENIRVMKSLFKASGFVNYISSVYLQNLCNAANDRFFRLTRQKLSLEITSDNCFQVRDFMNGGKVRSVKTLSGGQTFQAALSLALALADNIQKITESNQNFFFLDEGFGSLDRESLSVVFDTLKSLRKENRIVGVISHVEEMQQEIDVHLRVENDPEKGSLISSSWTS